jgi:hypothetical protein
MKLNDKITKQTLILGVSIMLFFFLGMFAGIYGIEESKNYFHQTIFILIFGSIGLLFGLVLSSFIKPYLKLDKRQLNNFVGIKLFICAGFIGIMLATGNFINSRLSEIKTFGRLTVVNKTFREERFRSPGANYLFVVIDGKTHRLKCDEDYWYNTKIGQTISLRIYKSKIGFDYIKMINEN